MGICEDKNIKNKLDEEMENFAKKGFRILAVAMKKETWKFVGIVALRDLPRKDSKDLIKALRNLGIKVKMLTGDKLEIAKEIGNELELGENIVSMEEIRKLKDKDAREASKIIDQADGFAESYPEDKYIVVKSLQSSGHVVGMTGYGVNDAPALKQAEVGIAVINATEIAKESASVVLTTEGLEGIITMVKTGRTIYQRILSWVLNMITKKIYLVLYIVTMLFLIHYFMLSVVGMVLLVFLGDFGTMTISTDKATYSMEPESFDVSWLFKFGLVLGILTAIEGVAFTIISFLFFGLDHDIKRIYTFGFVYLAISMMLNLMIVRERSHFWKSRPSNLLIITAVIEILFAGGISLFGFLDMSPLGYFPFLMIVIYVCVMTFFAQRPGKSVPNKQIPIEKIQSRIKTASQSVP